jgi:serine/threonine protein kinase
MAGVTVFDAGGQPIALTTTGRSGGEGQFFLLAAAPDECAKIYHPAKMTRERAAKLRSMIDNPPSDPAWVASRHRSIAWPERLLYSDQRAAAVVGFTMPLVNTRLFQEIHKYYDTQDRVAAFGGGFTWRHLLAVSLNLASSVAALHEKGHCVGDMRETNILVAPNALLAIIDTDSFQVRDHRTGTVYYTRVATGEYLPPELHGMAFASSDHDRYHSDLFALAVLVFKLLMLGAHPYQARGPLVEDAPTTLEKIRKGHFPYGVLRSDIHPPAYAPPYEVVPAAVRTLFARCFVEGHRNPSARPAAAEWYRALRQESHGLRQCRVNANHWHSTPAGCPWCQWVRAGNADSFPAETGSGQQVALPEPSRTVSSRDERVTYLRSYVRMALADGVIQEQERVQLCSLGARLGLSRDDVARIIDSELQKRPQARTIAPPPHSSAAVSTRDFQRSLSIAAATAGASFGALFGMLGRGGSALSFSLLAIVIVVAVSREAAGARYSATRPLLGLFQAIAQRTGAATAAGIVVIGGPAALALLWTTCMHVPVFGGLLCGALASAVVVLESAPALEQIQAGARARRGAGLRSVAASHIIGSTAAVAMALGLTALLGIAIGAGIAIGVLAGLCICTGTYLAQTKRL